VRLRGFAVQLHGKELSNELEEQMTKHSKFLYAMAKRLDEMISSGSHDVEANSIFTTTPSL